MKTAILLFSVATFFVVAFAYEVMDNPNKSKLPTNPADMKKHFEKIMGDDSLSLDEFKTMCYDIFQNEKGQTYVVPDDQIKKMYTAYDADNNGSMDRGEFNSCYTNMIEKVVFPKCALLVVDPQNDFMTGNLSIIKANPNQDGTEIIPPINYILHDIAWPVVVVTRDDHPPDHISFLPRGPWPVHCVHNTWGAEIPEELNLPSNAITIFKGNDRDVDSYSAFWDNNHVSQTTLHPQLQKLGITHLFLTGLATDICVAHTAFDGMEMGYGTTMVTDCCRGVDDKNIANTLQKITEQNGVLTTSDKMKPMVEGRDRRPEHGLKFAQDMESKKIKPKK